VAKKARDKEPVLKFLLVLMVITEN